MKIAIGTDDGKSVRKGYFGFLKTIRTRSTPVGSGARFSKMPRNVDVSRYNL